MLKKVVREIEMADVALFALQPHVYKVVKLSKEIT